MLAELDKDGAVALERTEGALCAAQVACLELVLVVGIRVALERVAVAVSASVDANCMMLYGRILLDVQSQRRRHAIRPLRRRPCMLCVLIERDDRRAHSNAASQDQKSPPPLAAPGN